MSRERMRYRMLRLAAPVVVSAGLVGLSACGSTHQLTSPKGVSVSTPQGGFSASDSAQLPSKFPKAVPIPTQSRVLGSAATIGGGSAFDVSFGVKGTIQSVARSYAAQLTQAGFSLNEQLSAGVEKIVEASSSQWMVMAAVSRGSGELHLDSGEVLLYMTVSGQS
jgi:hypothetical protein